MQPVIVITCLEALVRTATATELVPPPVLLGPLSTLAPAVVGPPTVDHTSSVAATARGASLMCVPAADVRRRPVPLVNRHSMSLGIQHTLLVKGDWRDKYAYNDTFHSVVWGWSGGRSPSLRSTVLKH